MKHKFLVIFAVFLILGFFCIIKTNAASLDFSNLQVDPSCSLKTIQNCDRDGLIMILIQLILQRIDNPVASNIPEQEATNEKVVSASKFENGLITNAQFGYPDVNCQDNKCIWKGLILNVPCGNTSVCASNAESQETLTLPENFSNVVLKNIQFDDNGTLYVNGNAVFSKTSGCSKIFETNIDITKYLNAGKNVIKAVVNNSCGLSMSARAIIEYNSTTLNKSNLPDLYLFNPTGISYTKLRDGTYGVGMTISNNGTLFNMCEQEVEILVENLQNQKTHVEKINPGPCKHSSGSVADPLFLGNSTHKIEFGFPLVNLGLTNNEYAKIRIVLDPNSKIKEFNENNNSFTTYIGIKKDLEKYSKFSATEVVEDNLPESITFWSPAFCPDRYTNYVYSAPEGYELVSCEMGQTGTHGGCSYCAMSKIKLKANKKTDISGAYIKITSPKMEEALVVGETYKIQFETNRITSMYLSHNSGEGAMLIRDEVPSKTGFFELKIPEHYNKKDKIVIMVWDSLNDGVSDTVEYKIKALGEATEKKFLSPTANTELCKGKSVVVKWQGEKDSLYNLMIASEDGYTSWSVVNNIKTDANGIGQFNWIIGKYSQNQKDLSRSKFKFYAQSVGSSGSTTLERVGFSEIITISNCDTVDDTVCITLYDPVCGSDGKTYSNECEANKAGTVIAQKGECSSIAFKAIPCGKYGDVDQDGKITNSDVTAANSKINDSNVDLLTIDVDGNKEAGFNDIVLINDYLTGKISTFPVCASTNNVSASLSEKGNPLELLKNWINNIFK